MSEGSPASQKIEIEEKQEPLESVENKNGHS